MEELAERKKAYKPFLTSSDARTALTYSNEIVKIDERLKVVKTEFERRTVAQPSGKAQAVKEAIKQSLTKEALKGPKKAPAVKHEGLKELEAVLKERLKEASEKVSAQRDYIKRATENLLSQETNPKTIERRGRWIARDKDDLRYLQRARTDYETALARLGGVESSFKELSKKLSKLSKNPKPQDLSELYATKEGLLGVDRVLSNTL